jgi:hypothetical protein
MNRVIILSGMGHSGTTITAYLLKQHPKIFCGINGKHSNVLENDWLKNKNFLPIRKLIENHPRKFILLKRPWLCYENTVGHWNANESFDFILDKIKSIKLVYCYKNFEEQARSWSKPKNYDVILRESSLERQKEVYDFYMKEVEKFSKVADVYYLNNHDLINTPGKTMDELSRWLGLGEFKFDLSMISDKKDIKDQI